MGDQLEACAPDHVEERDAPLEWYDYEILPQIRPELRT